MIHSLSGCFRDSQAVVWRPSHHHLGEHVGGVAVESGDDNFHNAACRDDVADSDEDKGNEDVGDGLGKRRNMKYYLIFLLFIMICILLGESLRFPSNLMFSMAISVSPFPAVV